MNRIRIWDYEAVAKNTCPDYREVPDASARPGESQAEWRLRMLLRDLQALASNAETLIAAHPNFIPAADDLANGFDHHLGLATMCVEEGLITEGMLSCARAVDAKLTELSDRHDESLWTKEALSKHEAWYEIKRLAAEALTAMGYELEPPPPRSM